jgi:hypothetical protein
MVAATLAHRPVAVEAPESEMVPVVCQVCGTRMHALRTDIGQTIRCPDCHTENSIKAPAIVARPKGPSLDDAPEYKMSDPVERPAYRPLVAPRGEYAELAEFDPAQRPAGWARPQAAGTVVAPPADDGEEFQLAAIAEPPRPKVEIPILPPADADSRYDDGLIAGIDRRAPDAWKKAPFLLKIVEFMFYGSTLPRWIFYSLGLAVVLNLAFGAAANVNGGPFSQFLAVMLCIAFVILGSMYFTSLAAMLLAIVSDTANGEDEVDSWPDWNFFDWIGSAIFFPAAAFLAGLPGALVSIGLIAVSMDPMVAVVAAVVPIALSLFVLFPPVLFSMLAEGTILAPLSPHLRRSFQIASEGWLLFYLCSGALGIFGGAVAALAMLSHPVLNSIGAVGTITSLLLYCRLLGRLMWYVAQREARLAHAPQR